MIVPPFKWSETRTQIILSVCQILDILTTVSTRNGGEYSVILFNAEKEVRMISQKLAIIGAQLYHNYRVIWDKEVAKERSINDG